MNKVHFSNKLGNNNLRVNIFSNQKDSTINSSCQRCKWRCNFNDILYLQRCINDLCRQEIISSIKLFCLVINRFIIQFTSLFIYGICSSIPRRFNVDGGVFVIIGRFPNHPPVHLLFYKVNCQIIVVIKIMLWA